MKHIKFIYVSVGLILALSILLIGCALEPDEYRFVEWVGTDLGSPGEGACTLKDLALDPSDNKPVVAHRELNPPYAIHVKKWSTGTTWTDLGPSPPIYGESEAIAVDPSDSNPVLSFVDYDNGWNVHVLKWSSNTTWTDLGFPSTAGAGGWNGIPSVIIDTVDNRPLVAFCDDSNDGRIRVKKWLSGTTWTDYGFPSSGPGAFPWMVVSPSDNKPVVVFSDQDNGDRARVKKWSSGTTWTDLGFLSTSPVASATGIVLDPVDNKPVAGVTEGVIGSDTFLHILKWSSGTSWSDMGYPITGGGNFSLVLDPRDNRPVVSSWGDYHVDPPTKHIFSLFKWSGGTSWIDKGYLASVEHACFGVLAFNPSDNQMVVLYTDESGTLRVKKGDLP